MTETVDRWKLYRDMKADRDRLLNALHLVSGAMPASWREGEKNQRQAYRAVDRALNGRRTSLPDAIRSTVSVYCDHHDDAAEAAKVPEMTRWKRKQIAAMEADASRREDERP